MLQCQSLYTFCPSCRALHSALEDEPRRYSIRSPPLCPWTDHLDGPPLLARARSPPRFQRPLSLTLRFNCFILFIAFSTALSLSSLEPVVLVFLSAVSIRVSSLSLLLAATLTFLRIASTGTLRRDCSRMDIASLDSGGEVCDMVGGWHWCVTAHDRYVQSQTPRVRGWEVEERKGDSLGSWLREWQWGSECPALPCPAAGGLCDRGEADAEGRVDVEGRGHGDTLYSHLQSDIEKRIREEKTGDEYSSSRGCTDALLLAMRERVHLHRRYRYCSLAGPRLPASPPTSSRHRSTI